MLLCVAACALSITEKPGQTAVSGNTPVVSPTIKSALDCVTACAYSICYACDYDNDTKTCYFNPTHQVATIANPAFNHFDLQYPSDCITGPGCTS